MIRRIQLCFLCFSFLLILTFSSGSLICVNILVRWTGGIRRQDYSLTECFSEAFVKNCIIYYSLMTQKHNECEKSISKYVSKKCISIGNVPEISLD